MIIVYPPNNSWLNTAHNIHTSLLLLLAFLMSYFPSLSLSVKAFLANKDKNLQQKSDVKQLEIKYKDLQFVEKFCAGN